MLAGLHDVPTWYCQETSDQARLFSVILIRLDWSLYISALERERRMKDNFVVHNA